jgi:hypothetical protein
MMRKTTAVEQKPLEKTYCSHTVLLMGAKSEKPYE